MHIATSLIILLFWVDLGHATISLLEPNCGVSLAGSRVSTRIIHGEVAEIHRNPWMVHIDSETTACGGSLITSRFVLTAAHCQSRGRTVAYLGEFNILTRRDCTRQGCIPNAIGIPVDAQIPHPRNVNLNNDIALFRLARRVQYTDYIKPICLPTNYNPLSQIRHFTAVGWGETERGINSNVLKTTTLTQVDRSYCSALYGRIDMSQICAGDRSNHVCRGDSGSPISAVIKINGVNRVVQAGLVSYGDYACRQFSVFSNVMFHMNWIVDVVRRDGSRTNGNSNRIPNNNRRRQG
ncbi:melanization protease 1-like [Drosophila eugracilis]|uniref:melanization protease 1-like n=1 Tax=Drosophila eugracilis TaxID=29029 RepID=UPI0007E87315|nr:melanization protease 1-like [Drosophila eugracilis]